MRRVVAGALAWLLLTAPVWAATAFRSSSSSTYASRANNTLTAPAGIANGDVLLLACSVGGAGAATGLTPPAGFSAVTGTYPVDVLDFGFNVDTYVWYKIASSESGDYTVTHSTAASQCYMAAVSGGTSAQPASTTNSGTGSTTTALTITPVANDSFVMFISQDWGDTANALSPPTGTTPTFTERLDPGTVSGIMYVADGVLATAGATGNKTITNNTATAAWAGILVVVEAAGGGSAETVGFYKRRIQ